MGNRELKDLRLQIRKTRQMLEANEQRRMHLQQGVRSRALCVLAAACGSGARWVRERPVRLLATAVVVLLGVASLVVASSTPDDGLRRHQIAALPDAGDAGPAANVTVTLDVADVDGEQVPDAESAGDPGAEPDSAPDAESGGGQAAGSDVSAGSPSGDEPPKVSADSPSGPAPAPGTESSDPSTAPELSDAGEPDPPASEPEPQDTSDPESPDDDADAAQGSCLGVSLLGLTVDLCL